MHYQEAGVPLIVIAGSDSRDGFVQGLGGQRTFLLGVRAVIARSFERIHRSNLVMMGCCRLRSSRVEDASSLGLDGLKLRRRHRRLLQPRQMLKVTATATDGSVIEFDAVARVDTPIEVDYLRNGGILHYVLRKMASA